MSLYNISKEMLRKETGAKLIVWTNYRSGPLRISPYFYNTIEENAIVIDAIAEILASRK